MIGALYLVAWSAVMAGLAWSLLTPKIGDRA